MAPHSSTLAWKIPWMEEPGRLQSMALGRVGHDWATSLSFFTFMLWRRKWKPTPCSCLKNPRDWGAWWAAVYGVAQSRTRLKRLSSSSSHPGIPHASQVDTKDLPSHQPIGTNKSGSFFSGLTYLPTLSIQDWQEPLHHSILKSNQT